VKSGVQLNHTEAPPASPAWFGSPISFDAPAFDALSVPPEAASAVADANWSFDGTAARIDADPASPAKTTIINTPARSATRDPTMRPLPGDSFVAA
jgi:hypothetical protein